MDLRNLKFRRYAKKGQTTQRIEDFNPNVSVDIGIVFELEECAMLETYKRKDKTQKGLKIGYK